MLHRNRFIVIVKTMGTKGVMKLTRKTLTLRTPARGQIHIIPHDHDREARGKSELVFGALECYDQVPDTDQITSLLWIFIIAFFYCYLTESTNHTSDFTSRFIAHRVPHECMYMNSVQARDPVRARQEPQDGGMPQVKQRGCDQR